MAVYGARVRDATGNIISDYSDNLGRMLGSFVGINGIGSYTDARLLMGMPVVFLVENTAALGNNNQAYVVGDTLYWNIPSTPNIFGTPTANILYGLM